MFRLHNGLCRRHCRTTQYVHFALHLWLQRTPLLAAIQRRHYQTTSFDPCRPTVMWWVIIVTSTCQGSIPFAPYAGSGDTLVAAAVLTTRDVTRLVPRCGVMCVVFVNITSARIP